MKLKTIFLFLIIIFPFFVKADLTDDQAEAVVAFAENLILKQQGGRHVDNNGLPLIAYNMGAMDRISGYNEQLITFAFDEKGINFINGQKWPFDCASWASYVYHHVLGVKTTIGDSARPLTVSKFLSNALNNIDFYVVRRNVSVDGIDSILKKGDLLIIEGSHIMVYVGNGKISHVSTSAITKGGSLGAEVIGLRTRFPGNVVTVIRLKGTNITPNTILTWPDTKEREDLGPKDNLPTIKIEYDNSKIIKDGTALITISDDRQISQYSISSKKDEYNWKSINKNRYTFNYVVKSNNTYYISAKDNNNQITTQTFTVTNIDSEKPIINKIEYVYNGDETYNVKVIVSDISKITYTLDNALYSNNVFQNLSMTNHSLVIQDEAGNVLDYKLDLSSSKVPVFSIDFAQNYQKNVTLSIKPINNDIIAYYALSENNTIPSKWDVYSGAGVNISRNGIYYLWVMSKDYIPYYQKVDINNIDNIPPVINGYKIERIDDDNYTIIINTTDSCDMEYSMINEPYQKSNIFSNLKRGSYTFIIRDCAYNVNTLTIDSTEFDKYGKEESLDISNNESFIDIFIKVIIIIVIIAIVYNIVMIVVSRKKNH